MGANIALRRAAKAARRKAVVAEKRRTEMLEGTLAVKVRRAASAPIQECLLQNALFEVGIGTLILARGISPNYLNVAVFLVDASCHGVKDVFFRSLGADELEAFVANMSETEPFVAVDPSYARKLLREVTARFKSIGFPPHRDFAAVEQLFGDVRADACDATFQFDHDGKAEDGPGRFVDGDAGAPQLGAAPHASGR